MDGQKNEEALEVMELAIIADKKNPLPMYQKANILVSMESFNAALGVLEELKEHAPRESSVYALMGRIYKRRNMYDKAMLHFGVALDLKPSATDVATIKVIGYSMYVPTHVYICMFSNVRLVKFFTTECEVGFNMSEHDGFCSSLFYCIVFLLLTWYQKE